MTGVRVHVDARRCQGHGRCLEIAGDVFGFDDREGRSFPVMEVWGALHIDRLRLAAEGCPERAISVEIPVGIDLPGAQVGAPGAKSETALEEGA